MPSLYGRHGCAPTSHRNPILHAAPAQRKPKNERPRILSSASRGGVGRPPPPQDRSPEDLFVEPPGTAPGWFTCVDAVSPTPELADSAAT
jgi:hypothetical protein